MRRWDDVIDIWHRNETLLSLSGFERGVGATFFASLLSTRTEMQYRSSGDFQ